MYYEKFYVIEIYMCEYDEVLKFESLKIYQNVKV